MGPVCISGNESNKYKAKQKELMFYMQPYEHLTGDARKVIDEVIAGMKAKWVSTFSLNFEVYVIFYFRIFASLIMVVYVLF